MRKIFWTSLLLVALAACGGSGTVEETADEEPGPTYPAELVSEGDGLFQQTCFTCHGTDGKGVPNLGKDLTTSDFVKSSTDDELLAFILKGRTADDPLNTTGIAMSPKGGFDFLTEGDIRAIIAFVRSIQE
jgi:disulfide bond formation protein DsbB